ncbi:hypothetical protein [Nocardia sp. NPDC051981]|uniref:hypothetical protein n=1 Tax=Nocardia sp. NPDC051981 TaxID=3155417 RepID=UPI00342EDD28
MDLRVGPPDLITARVLALPQLCEPRPIRGSRLPRSSPAPAGPILADADLSAVQVPILLIVGDHDPVVLELNRCTQRELLCENRLAVVARATQLCAEPGALERVAELACDWFLTHLTPAVIGGHSDTGKDSARS